MAQTCLNRCLCALCHHPVPDYAHLRRSINFVGYPSEDYRASFVDRGLPWDGAACGPLPTDVLWASFVGGEAAHDRTGGGLRTAEETERVGLVPRVHPL